MTTPLPPRPTSELVAIAWLASVPGLTQGMVAAQLPPDADKDGVPAEWVVKGRGFVTVATVGGNPDALLPVRRPVVQVDCWDVKPGSGKPPWGVANALGEAITLATFDRVTIPRPLTITVRGVRYPTAVVQGARMVTEFRRITDDAGDYARYQGDLWLQWIAPGLVLD